MNARVQAERVCAWVRENPGSFRRLMALAHREADRGNPCLTRSDAYAAMRDEGVAVSDGDGDPYEWEVVRNHNFWACLTRLMVMLRPRIARVVRFRDSEFDRVDLAEVWHATVNAGTTFLASSRAEAERLVDIDDASAR